MENHSTGGHSNGPSKNDEHILRLPRIHQPRPPSSSRPLTQSRRRPPTSTATKMGAGNICILPSIQQKPNNMVPASERAIAHVPRPPSKSPLKPSRTVKCIKRVANEFSEKYIDQTNQYEILPMIHPHCMTSIPHDAQVTDQDKVFGGWRQPLPKINIVKDEMRKYVINKPHSRLLPKRPQIKNSNMSQHCSSQPSSTHSMEANANPSGCNLPQSFCNYRAASSLSHNSTSEIVIDHNEFWDGPYSEQICLVQSSCNDLEQPSEEGIQKQRGFLDINNSADFDTDNESISGRPSTTHARMSPISGLSNHSIRSYHQ